MFMKKELNELFVIDLSKKKNEPEWMLEFRLKSFKKFLELDNPDFGPEIDIDFDNITYYKSDDKKLTNDWDKVSCNIRNSFEDLGVIDAENKYLGGVTNQFESEVVYHNQSVHYFQAYLPYLLLLIWLDCHTLILDNLAYL